MIGELRRSWPIGGVSCEPFFYAVCASPGRFQATSEGNRPISMPTLRRDPRNLGRTSRTRGEPRAQGGEAHKLRTLCVATARCARVGKSRRMAALICPPSSKRSSFHPRSPG